MGRFHKVIPRFLGVLHSFHSFIHRTRRRPRQLLQRMFPSQEHLANNVLVAEISPGRLPQQLQNHKPSFGKKANYFADFGKIRRFRSGIPGTAVQTKTRKSANAETAGNPVLCCHKKFKKNRGDKGRFLCYNNAKWSLCPLGQSAEKRDKEGHSFEILERLSGSGHSGGPCLCAKILCFHLQRSAGYGLPLPDPHRPDRSGPVERRRQLLPVAASGHGRCGAAGGDGGADDRVSLEPHPMVRMGDGTPASGV